MISAELHKAVYDEALGEFTTETLATLAVADDGSYSGENTERFGLAKAARDPETHERVLFTADPERWLRLLPGSYRSGDVSVAITHDDHPGHYAHATGGSAATGA